MPSAPSAAWITLQERLADNRNTIDQVHVPRDQVMLGDWMTLAACRDGIDPEEFHPVSTSTHVDVSSAQAACAKCPVMQACRQYRYGSGDSGVWGGVYYAVAAAAAAPRTMCALMMCTNPPRTDSPYCSDRCEHNAKAGTTAGFAFHTRTLIPVCKPCNDAKLARFARRPKSTPRTARASVDA